MNAFEEKPTARLATLDQLLEMTVPVFLDPPPARDTLRNWLDVAKIPRFKANPMARRGGGHVYYHVASVEKFFRGRLLPGRMTAPEVIL
jgi:hypothetical protein